MEEARRHRVRRGGLWARGLDLGVSWGTPALSSPPFLLRNLWLFPRFSGLSLCVVLALVAGAYSTPAWVPGGAVEGLCWMEPPKPKTPTGQNTLTPDLSSFPSAVTLGGKRGTGRGSGDSELCLPGCLDSHFNFSVQFQAWLVCWAARRET